MQDNEFTILWTSGVKKTQIVNLLFFSIDFHIFDLSYANNNYFTLFFK